MKELAERTADRLQRIGIKRLFALLFVATFVLSLIPVLVVSFYNHPSADDFSYSSLTAIAWRETHSISSVFAAVGEKVADTYNTWQGTYTAVALFSLQPSFFSEQLYFLTTFIILAAFIFSTTYLAKFLVTELCGADKYTFIIADICIMFLSMQFLPDATEAFFWFNGGIYYVGFYSASLVLLTLCAKEFLKSGTTKTGVGLKRVLKTVLIMLLALFIGGGNYNTALVTALALFALTFFAFLQKRSCRFVFLAAFALFFVSFLISVAAPGNAVRQAQLADVQKPPVQAVVYSYCWTMILFSDYLSAPVVLALLFMVPLAAVTAEKMSWDFKYPLLFAFFSFSAFAAQLTPTIYAMGGIGAGRQRDLYYFSFIWLAFMNMFYFVGWAVKRLNLKNAVQTMPQHLKRSMPLLLVPFILLFSGSCVSYYIDNDTGRTTGHCAVITTVDAVKALVNSSAARYDIQAEAREEIMKDTSIKEVVVEAYVNVPELFVEDGVQVDGSYWVNEGMAAFYQKESIVSLGRQNQ